MKKPLLLILFVLFGIVHTVNSQVVCGSVFTDPLGANADYVGNTDYTVTICPTNPGEVVTVTFTAFNTEANWDGLYVFNGNAIISPQIMSANPAANVPGGLAGSYWGTTIPGPFTSSDPSGCLTFRFRSDNSINRAGWIANVTCATMDTCLTPFNVIATGISEPATQTPQQIYRDLAWAGLNNTPVFDETFPIGNLNRQRILNRGACEQSGHPIGEGTPYVQNPIGQPCN